MKAVIFYQTETLNQPFEHLFNPLNSSSKVPCDLHFSIKLKKDCSPPRGCPIYSIDSKKSDVLEAYIKEKLALGHISKSKSSIVSPVILVPKGLKELRVCIDYRLLNDVTEIDHYPLPLLQDITTMISGSKIFSKIDLKDAFNQILVILSQRYLTAFKCKFGVFYIM